MGYLLWIVLCIVFSMPALAQDSGASTQNLAVGQGVSSPAVTHTGLFSKGFTKENPVAVSYQTSYRSTAAFDGSDSTSFGLDFGVGDSQYGLALGIYSNGCDGCDSFVRGAVGVIWSVFGFGVGVQEDLYTLGMLFNPNGLHRVGFVVEIDNPNGPDNNRSAYALGYSYVLPQFTFSADLSQQNTEDLLLSDGVMRFTPGIAVRVDIFSVSISYDIHISDSQRNFSDGVWVGLSAKPWSDVEFTFYGEYVDRWTLLATYTF